MWVDLEIQQPWGHWDIPGWTTLRVISLKLFEPCHLSEQKENLLALYQRVKYDMRTVLQCPETLPRVGTSKVGSPELVGVQGRLYGTR